MSGYGDGAILPHGLDADVPFLQKPITPSLLVRKVREVLQPGAAKKDRKKKSGTAARAGPSNAVTMAEPYRTEENAIAEKLRQVEEELTSIDQAAARREALAREAAGLRKRLKDARARGTLEDLRIASPCNASWEDMAGDDRVRHCGGCKKDVFNVSGMTRAEAVELVKSRSGGDLCLRMYRRADGTVLTADCPVGEQRRRVRRLVMVGAGVAGMAAGGLWFGSATTGAATMGDIASPEDRYTTGTTAVPTMGTATAMVPESAAPRAEPTPAPSASANPTTQRK